MQSELLQHLKEFISFRTTVDNPSMKQECLDWLLQAFLGGKLAEVQRGAIGNVPYLYLAHPDSELLWFAHIDVVPGEEKQFTVEVSGDKAFGRGTKDMKGAALAFLMAYRDALAEKKNPNVSILLTSDEETAGPTIPTLLDQGVVTAPIAFSADTGTNPHIVVEHKGVAWSDLIATGKGSHAAAPWEGENPIYLLSEALERIKERFPSGTYKDWCVTVSPAQLKGSNARNQVPDTVTCSLDIRFPPVLLTGDLNRRLTAEEAIALVQECLPEGCTIEARLTADPLSTDPQHPMVQRVQRIAQEVTGEEVPIGREHGASDARFFEAHGIPAFLYGPVGGGIHGKDEWVSVSSLKNQYEFSKRMLQELS